MSSEFDRCVEGVKATHVKTMLEAVIVKGHAQLFWRRFLSNEEDNQLKLECLRRIVTIMLTDEPVKRSDVLAGTPGNGPTVGMFEAMGLVQCEVQVSDDARNCPPSLKDQSLRTFSPTHAANSQQQLSVHQPAVLSAVSSTTPFLVAPNTSVRGCRSRH